jgi:hypothetical protein
VELSHEYTEESKHALVLYKHSIVALVIETVAANTHFISTCLLPITVPLHNTGLGGKVSIQYYSLNHNIKANSGKVYIPLCICVILFFAITRQDVGRVSEVTSDK